ncbi:hypothetical protein SLEP1_g48312 [Rubroshorea leprosula]|uniref:Transposase n=1 Tax=Rubroshorea leprosula TaxID=152421 RepID=A0AAV5LW35_9ROSI|nr:hypothetical protein SLEP1_g48312 [Rubroshorea leprosula]
MDKSNFKITTHDEIDIALSAQYRLNLPIVVDESKVDKRLFERYFEKHSRDNLPHFAHKYIIFRRGFGIDHMTAFFVNAKINTIIARVWRCFMTMTGLKRIFSGKRKQDAVQPIELKIDDADHQDGLYVERIRIEKLKLRF